MYKALIDIDSLIDPSVLKNYEVIETYTEYWEGEDPDTLHIAKVSVKDSEFEMLCANLSKNWLKEEWFSVIWNEINLYIVFKNKIFSTKNVTPFDELDFREVLQYGKSKGIKEEYFLNIPKVVSKF